MITRFELARILGVRVLQLSLGAPPFIKVKNGSSATEIAKQEIEKGALPITAIRDFPDGHKEMFNLNGEMIGKTA